MNSASKWLRKRYNKSIHDLAFYPLLIMFGFLGLAIILLELDKTGAGERINDRIKWLTLKETDTATTIVSTVAAGIISLMVFSYSMVMVVMIQAASQMSNRLLDHLIGGRFQKLVLSFYVGTIVFAFVVLSNIDGEKENAIPVVSIYFLILLTIVDIFFFVRFLHFITQSIRYEQLIQAVHLKARNSLVNFTQKREAVDDEKDIEGEAIPANESGYYQGFSTERLMRICTEENLVIRFLHVKGEYVLKGIPLFVLQAEKTVSPQVLKRILADIDFFYGQEIDKNPYYGFFHLMEAGVKALSPGINDPGTAVYSLNAMADLLAYRMDNHLPGLFCDAKGCPRIISKEHSFEELFRRSLLPIWDYGRHDRTIQQALLRLLSQLQVKDREDRYDYLFKQLEEDIATAQKEVPRHP